MLLRFIVMLALVLAAAVGLPCGIFESYTWLWVLLGIAAAGIAIYCTNGNEGSTTNSNTPTAPPPIAAPTKPDEEIPMVVLTEEEQRGARKTLTAAAMTYVAATAVSLAQVLRLILVFGRRRRD